MLKRTLLSLVALLACAYASAASFNETEVRLTQNFNKDWRFSLSDNPDYRNPEFKDSKWRALDLPHDWSIESEYTPDFPAGKNNGFFSEGLGWYRKSFSLPADLSKKQFVIQFDGVYMNSEVWINGRYLGRRPYGYATFRYDLTAYLNFGEDKTNVIAVRVDNSNPGGDRWYHGSGIYRDVHLYITNYVHFKHDGGVYITTPMAEKELAVVNVEYELFGSFFDDKEINTYKRNGWSRAETKWKNEPKPHDCIIRSIVYDYEGNEVGRTEQNHIIKNYEMDYKASMQVPVAKPNRWSDKNPYLYYMKSQIEYKGKILDDVVTRFGIRKVELRPTKGLYVNEEMVKLKGVCLHHDAGALGAAVPDKSWVYRLNKLKEMGCNSIRTSHNPASPAFLALCDSLGFYVKDETVDEWTCGWAVNWTENPTGKSMNGYQHLFNQWAETDIREQIRRDRNHPSVIIYTLGNEIPDYRHYAKSEKTIAKLVSYCKEEDPTRPVCLGDNSYMTTSKFGVIDHLDLLGFNYIERDQGEAMYDNVYAQNPDKLTLGSETSSETMYFLEVRDNDYVIGQYIWTGIDYLGEVKKLGQRGWNTSLLDLTLQMRSEGAKFKSFWSEEPTMQIITSNQSVTKPLESVVFSEAGEKVTIMAERRLAWNWEDSEDKYAIIYSNCDEVELLQDGKSVGRQPRDKDEYYTEFKIPYRAGKLEAIGYIGGKKVATNMVETTGTPVAIKATPVWSELKRDGEDVTIIEIEIVDSEGRTVPYATNNVKAKVAGGAKLLAVDSPNLYYTGLFTADNREAERGRLMVTIKSTGEDKPTSVTLTSKGLKSAVVNF